MSELSRIFCFDDILKKEETDSSHDIDVVGLFPLSCS